jgi:hypothetical protein
MKTVSIVAKLKILEVGFNTEVRRLCANEKYLEPTLENNVAGCVVKENALIVALFKLNA